MSLPKFVPFSGVSSSSPIPVNTSAYAKRRVKAKYNRALTETERRIVDLVVMGLRNIPIALSMRTSEQVIKNKLGIIFVKMAVTSRSQLIAKELKRRYEGVSK